MNTKKVLVVDDAPAHLAYLKNIVEKAGCEVIIAETGRIAVDKAFSEKPDLILMDIVMDDLDGYGACREILSNPETANMPIVFVTTKSHRADHIWSKRQGAREMISKPFEDQQILDVIARY